MLRPLLLSRDALRWVFVATILAASLITLFEASGVGGELTNPHVTVLAMVETAAIVAYASERWRSAAALVLLLVFAIAFVLSAIGGEFAARFIYFAASTIYLQGADRISNQEPQRG